MWEDLTRQLEGSIVVLEPLGVEHRDGLLAAAQEAEIWRWLPHLGSSEEYFDGWFQGSLTACAEGREGVFATIDRETAEPIGSTRFMTLRPEHRGLEIGFTWLAQAMWGSGANAEAKLLMLAHAFDRLGCMRVEFKTDARNARSRRALEALPAQFEGILRRHMDMPDVGVRDSAYYSVIEQEWPSVRSNLERRVAKALAKR